MAEETYLAAMTYNSLFSPVLDKLEGKDGAVVQTLRSALQAADREQPGFLFDMVRTILAKSELNVSLQEGFLRLQAQAPVDDLLIKNKRAGDPLFQELSQRAIALRKILARIPDEIADRRRFLETIKEIASSIKKLLDATNNLLQSVPEFAQPPIEQRKREFVKYSKRFSNTLKEYFRVEDHVQVFVSANQLIYQTTLIIKTVRDKLDA